MAPGARWPRSAILAGWPSSSTNCSTIRADGRRWPPAGAQLVAAYDWPVVAATVVKVYETVIAADPRAVSEAD